MCLTFLKTNPNTATAMATAMAMVFTVMDIMKMKEKEPYLVKQNVSLNENRFTRCRFYFSGNLIETR